MAKQPEHLGLYKVVQVSYNKQSSDYSESLEEKINAFLVNEGCEEIGRLDGEVEYDAELITEWEAFESRLNRKFPEVSTKFTEYEDDTEIEFSYDVQSLYVTIGEED